MIDQSGLPDLQSEINFSTSRSSGKGGQHVNTTETRVELKFNIPASELLSDVQKSMLMSRLGHRLSKEGTVRMYSQKERSQSANKADVLLRFYMLIAKALRPVKKRVRHKVSNASRENRLAEKKAVTQKKDLRKPPEL